MGNKNSHNTPPGVPERPGRSVQNQNQNRPVPGLQKRGVMTYPVVQSNTHSAPEKRREREREQGGPRRCKEAPISKERNDSKEFGREKERERSRDRESANPRASSSSTNPSTSNTGTNPLAKTDSDQKAPKKSVESIAGAGSKEGKKGGTRRSHKKERTASVEVVEEKEKDKNIDRKKSGESVVANKFKEMRKKAGKMKKDEGTEFERVKVKARPARSKKTAEDGIRNLQRMKFRESDQTDSPPLKSFEETMDEDVRTCLKPTEKDVSPVDKEKEKEKEKEKDKDKEKEEKRNNRTVDCTQEKAPSVETKDEPAEITGKQNSNEKAVAPTEPAPNP